MLTHRPYQPSDLEAICNFPQNAEELFFFFPKASYPLKVEQLALSIGQRQYATVIEEADIIAGFADFYSWEMSGCCKVGHVIVNPTLRDQGIASYLMRTMLQKARTSYQAKQIQVSCFNQNTAGLLLYKKLGFTPFDIELRTNKQGQKVALIHLLYDVD